MAKLDRKTNEAIAGIFRKSGSKDCCFDVEALSY
jgi:hypothetical protein